MSRIEGGALKVEMEWYAPATLVQDVLEHMRPALQDRPVTVNLPADLPPVELDYLLMNQVLTNLLENALRYTPPGSPIEVNAGLQDKRVLISVADRGTGIPPDELERIFDKFYRMPLEQQQTGLGLGLAVCRGFVEAQGGQIWAEPRPGGGAIFFVALPVRHFERNPV